MTLTCVVPVRQDCRKCDAGHQVWKTVFIGRTMRQAEFSRKTIGSLSTHQWRCGRLDGLHKMGNSTAFAIEAFDAKELLESHRLLNEWDSFLEAYSHVNALYASTVWVAHLVATADSPVRVLFCRDRAGRLTGVVPVRLRQYALSFDIASKTLLRTKILTAEVLGSVLLLSEDSDVHASMIMEILSGWPDCQAVYLEGFTDSFFGNTCALLCASSRLLLAPDRRSAALASGRASSVV